MKKNLKIVKLIFDTDMTKCWSLLNAGSLCNLCTVNVVLFGQ